MDILNIVKKINDFNGSIDKFDSYQIDESCNLYGLKPEFGTGIYLTEKGLIKRYSMADKDITGRKTGDYTLMDKRIMPCYLYPTKSIFVNNKYEMELTDGKIKRMLTDDALINLREFKKYIQQFSREYWFDGDNDDVTKIHKIIIQLKNELNIKTEKVLNQFGWNDNNFSPYDINVFIDDPTLKELEDSFNVKGDEKVWLEKVNKYRDNILFETQFLTSLAGPILSKLKLMPMWVHLIGKSSQCKTASMIVYASMYGCPIDDGRNLIASFNTTIVGLENRANLFNNFPVFLNDSQNLSPYIRPEDLIYLGFEGKGRNRGNKNDQNRQVKRWMTTFVTNGERPLLGRASYEGAVKRCIQISGQSMELSEGKKVRRIFYENYGHIGRKWINILKNIDKEQCYTIIDYINNELSSRTNNLDDNINQVATMVLCQYLFEININGVIKEIALNKAINTGVKILSLIDVNKESADMCNKIVYYLKDFVIQNMSRFKENEQLTQERFGFLKDGNVVFFNNKLDEILTKEFNYDPKLFRKEIKERNLVVMDEKGQFKQVKYDKSNARYPQFLSSVIFGEIEIDNNKLLKIEREGIKIG